MYILYHACGSLSCAIFAFSIKEKETLINTWVAKTVARIAKHEKTMLQGILEHKTYFIAKLIHFSTPQLSS